jgi:tRNA A37 threonylcarbamoyladenosine biosynthesis protein TsaE
MKNIGLDEQIKNSENLIFIEWPEIIKKELEEKIDKNKKINLKFKYINENQREIKIE